MQRRDFVSGGLGVILGTVGTYFASGLSKNKASGVSSPNVNSGKRELTMVSTWPRNFPGLGIGAQRVADQITTATEGRISVKLHASGELVPPLECFDAVVNGTADCFHGASYYWQGKHKALNFYTAVPLGFTANELMAWVLFGGGQSLWDEIYEGFGLKGLIAGNTGVQTGGWFRKEINSLEDFKGLKMRIPGLGGAVLNKIGGESITLPGSEIFGALQSGAIDATEWVGPYNDLAMGFYKVAKYFYYPGFHEPGSGLEFTMRKDVWDSFSKSDQTLIQAVCNAESTVMLAEYNAANSDSLDILVNKHGVKVKKFNDTIFNALAKESHAVVREVAEADRMTKRVYESYIKFRKKAVNWTKLSEQAYTNARSTSEI